MPLLGSCHIPQAQGNQLGPRVQAPATPGDLLKSSSPPLPSLNLPGTHPWLWMPPAPSPSTARLNNKDWSPEKVKIVSSFRETSWSLWNADTQLQGLGHVTLPFWVFISSPKQ